MIEELKNALVAAPENPFLQGHVEALAAANSRRSAGAVVGYWTPVTAEMPDDEITVLVWMGSMEDATLAYHDSEVLERRADSGWIMAETVTPGRVLIDVTHWCAKICPPNA